MNRRYEHILLNGVPFTLDTKFTQCYRDIGSYGDIDNAYARPSDRKRAIYKDWWHWFRQNSGDCGVSSKNCNFFTIMGYVKDENGNVYNCMITHANHYCWKVVEA